MKLAFFGGSFDPPHTGHVAIVRYVIEANLAGRVIVAPCFHHPFQKESASFGDRFEMCRLAFSSFGERVEVSDMEKQLGGMSYTIHTVDELIKHHPHDSILMVVGADAAASIGQWKEGSRLQKIAKMIVIPRGIGSTIPDVSSTEIRQKCAQGKSLLGYVPSEVKAYIQQNRLYRFCHSGLDPESSP